MVLVATSMVIGLISGILRPRFLAEHAYADLIASLQHFSAAFDDQSIGISAFFAAILRYGRPLLLIWACATLPKARFAALLVLYLRAMALGFSATMMVRAFGGSGFAAALALYGLQNLIIMPIYACTAYFIIQKHGGFDLKLGGIGLVAVIAASMTEAYVSPMLLAMIWR